MTTPPAPVSSAMPLLPRPRTWFDRNWKWLVPLLIVAAASLIVGSFGALFYGIESSFRTSYPYQVAVQRATESPEVAAAIGKPLHIGWLISGNASFKGSEADANFSIPISGPNGAGHIVVAGKKRANHWTLDVLEVDVGGRDQPIQLLESAPAATPDADRHST
jgi:Cytochrome oxidase complex assembly protein 1